MFSATLQRASCATLLRLAPALAFTVVSLVPRSAQSCGSTPTPASTISSVAPASGATGVARDIGIIVSGTTSALNSNAVIDADVELFDVDSGAAVPLIDGSWFSRSGPESRVSAHPAEPLEPLHTYRIEATTRDPNTGIRSAPVVSQFVTSDAVLEPLVISGELGFSLRAGEADVVDYPPCGIGTTVIGKRPALFAEVQLPVPSGGQGFYQGVLHFTDHTPARVDPLTVSDYVRSGGEPHDIQLRQSFELEAGEALVLSQQLFEEELAYAACFTFVIWDPAGHVAQTSACLPVLSADNIRALAQGAVDPEPTEVVASEPVEGEVQTVVPPRSAPFLGCSVLGPREPASAPVWASLLLAGVIMALTGWRRCSGKQHASNRDY